MARFTYKAIAAGGEVIDGEITAESRDDAARAVRNRGAVPVAITRARERRLALPALRARRRLRRADLMLFTRQLEMMLGAGTALDRALEILRRIHGQAPLGRLAAELNDRLRGGASLAEALEARADVFRPDYVGMVRAGEAGGALGPALARLADMLEKSETLAQSVRSALAYPLLVLILAGLSLVILLVYVVPEFRPMLEGVDDLPLLTTAVLAVSGAAVAWGWLALPLALALGLVGVSAARSPGARRRLGRLRLATPLLGELTRRLETARFCRTLGALLQNGVPILQGLEVAAGTIGNPAIAEAARQAAGPLARGEGLARPLGASGHFPEMALQLIAVGEESGRLPRMLEQVADVYDRETQAAIQRMLALLTPAVTIGLGVLIALIIGSILSAILGSYDFAA
ncbi:MAG TPA: type II secretion system F family protein [Thermohalobaculum sp.]|nr:type II secretion system F family protein [Thermohalobaculum sp.]